MRALYNIRHGGYEVLQVREANDLVPARGQVLIRVARAGLNFSDLMARMGMYPEAPKPPMVMGYEAAGTIESVGTEVTGFSPGDRVLALSHFGAQATHLCVPAEYAFRIPDEMSFDQAAALPVNYLTAFHILHHVACLRPRRKVLIHMAAGGVGLAAIQLCRLVEGVELFGTSSASKHALLREAGVQHPIDYRNTDYAEQVREQTQGKGVDLILDPVGPHSWRKGYELLAPGGQLVMFGMSELVPGATRTFSAVLKTFLSIRRFSPLKLMADNRTVSGVNMLPLLSDQMLLKESFQALMSLYQAGKIEPKVSRAFPLAEASAAHRYMQERKSVGKVLLDCA